MACVMKVPMLLPGREGRKQRLLNYIINLVAAQAATVTGYATRALATIRAAQKVLIEAASRPFNAHPSNQPEGFDAPDASDPLAVAEYADDIYKFYKCCEVYMSAADPPLDYIQHQADVSEGMRAGVIDLMIAVHGRYGLTPETLFLAVNLMDRYLSVKRVQGSRLELIGMSAFLIACKYEEVRPPEVTSIMYTTDAAYTREEMLATETEILDSLQWTLTVPTQYMFLACFLRPGMCRDIKMEQMAFFLAELGLMRYSMATCLPSVAAASAVYAAQCTLNKTPRWPEKMKLHTGLSEAQLTDRAHILVECHADAQARSNLKVVYDKYSTAQYGAVALHPPAGELLRRTAAC